MRTVRDEDGATYLVVKRSDEAWLVRNPATGTSKYVDPDTVTPIETPPLETAATAIPESVRAVMFAIDSETALGILVELAERGPTPTRELFGAVELCESDFHGLLAELQAGDMVAAESIAGEPGYVLTDEAATGLELLRDDAMPS